LGRPDRPPTGPGKHASPPRPPQKSRKRFLTPLPHSPLPHFLPLISSKSSSSIGKAESLITRRCSNRLQNPLGPLPESILRTGQLAHRELGESKGEAEHGRRPHAAIAAFQ
jgi:hypothetical protein